MTRLRWNQDGFSVLCGVLAGRISPSPAVEDIAVAVRALLDAPLEDVEQLAARWPGRSLRITILQQNTLLLAIDLVPTDGPEVWGASVARRPTLTRRQASDLTTLVQSVRFEVAIAGEIVLDGMVINDADKYAAVDGTECHLTRTEWRLLRALLHAAGDVVNREQLRLLGIHGHELTDGALRTHVRRLRATLSGHGHRIETVPCVGYRLDLERPSTEIVAGPLRLRPGTRQAWRRGNSLHLTPSEFDVLDRLARRRGQFLSADDLRRAGGANSRNSVKVRIANLRAKLGPDRGMIRTRPGSGYCLDPQPDADRPEHRTTLRAGSFSWAPRAWCGAHASLSTQDSSHLIGESRVFILDRRGARHRGGLRARRHGARRRGCRWAEPNCRRPHLVRGACQTARAGHLHLHRGLRAQCAGPHPSRRVASWLT